MDTKKKKKFCHDKLMDKMINNYLLVFRAVVLNLVGGTEPHKFHNANSPNLSLVENKVWLFFQIQDIDALFTGSARNREFDNKNK